MDPPCNDSAEYKNLPTLERVRLTMESNSLWVLVASTIAKTHTEEVEHLIQHQATEIRISLKSEPVLLRDEVTFIILMYNSSRLCSFIILYSP